MGSAFAFTLRSKTAISDHDSPRSISSSLNATPRRAWIVSAMCRASASGSANESATMSPLSEGCAPVGFIAFVSRAPFCSMKARAVSTTPSLERKFSSREICSTSGYRSANVRMFATSLPRHW